MTDKEINELLYPCIEEDIPSYNDVSITINEEISPFARQNIIIKEE